MYVYFRRFQFQRPFSRLQSWIGGLVRKVLPNLPGQVHLPDDDKPGVSRIYFHSVKITHATIAGVAATIASYQQLEL